MKTFNAFVKPELATDANAVELMAQAIQEEMKATPAARSVRIDHMPFSVDENSPHGYLLVRIADTEAEAAKSILANHPKVSAVKSMEIVAHRNPEVIDEGRSSSGRY